MFGLLDGLVDSVDNGLSIVGGILEGEAPSRRKVAKLVADGVEVAVIASAFGVAESVITDMLDS